MLCEFLDMNGATSMALDRNAALDKCGNARVSHCYDGVPKEIEQERQGGKTECRSRQTGGKSYGDTGGDCTFYVEDWSLTC